MGIRRYLPWVEEAGGTGAVEAIFLSERRGAPMEPVDSVEAVAGRGLRGDRYFTNRGYYSGFDDCEVTLLEAAAIEAVREEHGIDLSDGRHRRNVVVSGLRVHDLLGERFRVGGATLRGTRPRPPCAHVERVAGEDGVAEALSGTRGGICADVIEHGTLRVGDPVCPGTGRFPW